MKLETPVRMVTNVEIVFLSDNFFPSSVFFFPSFYSNKEDA